MRIGHVIILMLLSLLGGCSRSPNMMPSERVRGGMTFQEADRAMAGPGRKARDMLSDDDNVTSPNLKRRLEKIMNDNSHGRDIACTVIVWREKQGNDEWITCVDFKDGKATGSGGCWLRLPDE